jgi:peptide deformylase
MEDNNNPVDATQQVTYRFHVHQSAQNTTNEELDQLRKKRWFDRMQNINLRNIKENLRKKYVDTKTSLANRKWKKDAQRLKNWGVARFMLMVAFLMSISAWKKKIDAYSVGLVRKQSPDELDIPAEQLTWRHTPVGKVFSKYIPSNIKESILFSVGAFCVLIFVVYIWRMFHATVVSNMPKLQIEVIDMKTACSLSHSEIERRIKLMNGEVPLLDNDITVSMLSNHDEFPCVHCPHATGKLENLISPDSVISMLLHDPVGRHFIKSVPFDANQCSNCKLQDDVRMLDLAAEMHAYMEEHPSAPCTYGLEFGYALRVFMLRLKDGSLTLYANPFSVEAISKKGKVVKSESAFPLFVGSPSGAEVHERVVDIERWRSVTFDADMYIPEKKKWRRVSGHAVHDDLAVCVQHIVDQFNGMSTSLRQLYNAYLSEIHDDTATQVESPLLGEEHVVWSNVAYALWSDEYNQEELNIFPS